jgi:hypothetical protein
MSSLRLGAEEPAPGKMTPGHYELLQETPCDEKMGLRELPVKCTDNPLMLED